MDFALADRAAVLDGTLVLADLHLGKAAASDVQAPLGEREDAVDRVAALCDRFDPDEVAVAGDLLHSFSTLPRGVADAVADLRRTCRDAGADLLVTPGNHDTMLDGLWSGPTADEHRVGDDVVVCHGHRRPNATAAGYVVGHDHPTIEIEGRRRPCYLYGEDQFRGAELLMLPAFTRLSAGVAVNRMRARDFQSPLVTDADALRPLVVDEDAAERSASNPPSASARGDSGEVLPFPPLGEFRDML